METTEEEHFSKHTRMLRTFACTACKDEKQWYQKKISASQLIVGADHRQWCWKCGQITPHVEVTFNASQNT